MNLQGLRWTPVLYMNPNVLYGIEKKFHLCIWHFCILSVIPIVRITSSALLAPAKAAAWMGKWPSLFCLQSFAPCFSFDTKEMDGEEDKQRPVFVRDKSCSGLAIRIKNSYIICSAHVDSYLFQADVGRQHKWIWMLCYWTYQHLESSTVVGGAGQHHWGVPKVSL